ncbi:MAG: hypothetical protein ACRDL3_05245 [Solirubrobacterales bacterium]
MLLVGLLAPAPAGAKTLTKQTELGEVVVDGRDYSLTPDGATDPLDAQAHAAGSPLGRIPSRCMQRRKLRRKAVCLVNKLFAADIVAIAFLVGASEGEGSLACPVLIESERIRLGGAACPQRIAAGAQQFALRRPELVYLAGTGFGRRATAEAVVLMSHPREAALIQLAVTPRRYWRITDVSDLFP